MHKFHPQNFICLEKIINILHRPIEEKKDGTEKQKMWDAVTSPPKNKKRKKENGGERPAKKYRKKERRARRDLFFQKRSRKDTGVCAPKPQKYFPPPPNSFPNGTNTPFSYPRSQSSSSQPTHLLTWSIPINMIAICKGIQSQKGENIMHIFMDWWLACLAQRRGASNSTSSTCTYNPRIPHSSAISSMHPSIRWLEKRSNPFMSRSW